VADDKKQQALFQTPEHEAEIRQLAKQWLERDSTHVASCQCHRCTWAHGVIAGRITSTFEIWRHR
jgi:hypothetical protein